MSAFSFSWAALVFSLSRTAEVLADSIQIYDHAFFHVAGNDVDVLFYSPPVLFGGLFASAAVTVVVALFLRPSVIDSRQLSAATQIVPAVLLITPLDPVLSQILTLL